VTRGPAPASGAAARTACARVLVRGGTDEKSGEALSAAPVAERVAWCATLVQGIAGRLVADRWNPADLGTLASGRDAAGRPLPSQAWMALRRLGWAAVPPDGVTVNDRIARMTQELAGRTLRSACWRDALTRAVTATWPTDPARRTPGDGDAGRAAAPGGEHLPSAVIRARSRQVARYLQGQGQLPADVTELEAPPRVPTMLILAACDRQQAAVERDETDPRRALLRLQLPTRPDPRGYRDWSWVAAPLALPPTVPTAATLHLPTLRPAGGQVMADVAFTSPAPHGRRAGHTVALGIDWGLNTLLSAGACRLNPDGTITALGAGAQYRAGGVLAKQHRLRRQGEALHAKLGHHERLIAGRHDHPLNAKAAVLRDEARHVADRRSHLNDALAWSAARWAADQAIAAGATVIYVEDLRSMEARGMGRTLNTRLSQTVRGQVAERLRHIAAEHGIAVVTVPPRGTSKNCPRCLSPLRHCQSPDQPTVPGWKWARCPGAAGRATATTAPGSGSPPAASPTRPRPRPTATTASWPCAPSTTSSKPGLSLPLTLPGGTAPRAARRLGGAPHAARPGDARHPPRRDHQATAASVRRDARHRPGPRCPAQPAGTSARARPAQLPPGAPARRPHRARGAALGAGFHLSAHATPSRREPDPQHHPANTG
jgi:IS605 OrfB family transposase